MYLQAVRNLIDLLKAHEEGPEALKRVTERIYGNRGGDTAKPPSTPAGSSE